MRGSGGFCRAEQRAVFLAVSAGEAVFLLAVFGAVFSKLKIKLLLLCKAAL